MAIYNKDGAQLLTALDIDGNALSSAYDADGLLVFSKSTLPVPSGDLVADESVPLPSIYGDGHGFTCTGLAYDGGSNTFLVGDIGKQLPSSPGFASQIVRLSYDFSTVVETIPLHSTFQEMADIQGIAIDSDGTIWFCSTEEKKIRHIDRNGNSLGYISFTNKPTGVAYSATDNSFWVLTYGTSNNILHVNKYGEVLAQFTFSYQATLDQCFLDETHGYLYMTAGDNYSSRNDIYVFDISTHSQGVACTVDSYSVEGLWIGMDAMVIVNDGYYHSAAVPTNLANFYNL